MFLKPQKFHFLNKRLFRTSAVLCGWWQNVAVGYGIPVPKNMGSGYRFKVEQPDRSTVIDIDYATIFPVNIHTTGRLLGMTVYGPFKNITGVEGVVPEFDRIYNELFTIEELRRFGQDNNIINTNRLMHNKLIDFIKNENLIDQKLDELLKPHSEKEILEFNRSLTTNLFNNMRDYYGYYIISM